MAVGAPVHPCVLIVDDVQRTRQRVARLIYQRGYDTLEAGSSREAQDVLRERRAEICAIVLNLPGERASRAVDEHRDGCDVARVPVVVIPVEQEDLLRPAVSQELDNAIVGYCLGERWGNLSPTSSERGRLDPHGAPNQTNAS